MKQLDITQNDMSISMESDYFVEFSWTAVYSSSKVLDIKLNLDTSLQGGEKLKIKLVNDKTFRTPTGG